MLAAVTDHIHASGYVDMALTFHAFDMKFMQNLKIFYFSVYFICKNWCPIL